MAARMAVRVRQLAESDLDGFWRYTLIRLPGRSTALSQRLGRNYNMAGSHIEWAGRI
jgi:hypothetical protein